MSETTPTLRPDGRPTIIMNPSRVIAARWIREAKATDQGIADAMEMLDDMIMRDEALLAVVVRERDDLRARRNGAVTHREMAKLNEAFLVCQGRIAERERAIYNMRWQMIELRHASVTS